MKRLAVCVLMLALAVIPAGPAQAFSPDVELDEFTVTPTTFVSTPGETVSFGNAGLVTHTAKQDAPFKLWNTGDIAPLGAQDVNMNWAGTFKFHCKYHPDMKGRIKTPMDTQSGTTIVGVPVNVGFGDTAAPSGMKYEAQMRRDGGNWRDFAFTRRAMVPFDPSRTGTYDFRSRLVLLERGAGRDPHSGWSPQDPLSSQVVVS